MNDTKNRDWHDMTPDELRNELRVWRARALQNRAELQLEHRNLMGLKVKLKSTEQRLAELEGKA